MSYSRENERQNKVLSDLISGQTPEKRIMVGYEGDAVKQGDKIDRMTDIFKDARMPWFCSECKKTMKIKLDNKMWRLYGHCFDCQIKIETKLKASGEYEEWEKNKIKENKKSYVKDMLQGLESWENEKMPGIYNSVGLVQVELKEEHWNANKEHIKKLAEDARKYLYNLLEKEDGEDGNGTNR